jgi:HD-like signal output (HDOD) protein/ActR/RegA family two-component response regulator
MTAVPVEQPRPARRVLFVDDEPNLLAGLRRMLRFKRDIWEMDFAEGGQAALAKLAERRFDVVVSDMRMPGMDGGQLLAHVRQLYPRTARVILSGHADRGAIISAVGPTQQYLAKPCEVDVLVGVLDRVLAVRDLIVDDDLADLLGGVESLPKPPQIYEEMLAISTNENSTLEEVVAVIEGDMATSAEVLRLVNTAFFGLPSEVTTVNRAVSLLGLETIQALAVAGAVFGAGGSPPPGIDAAQLSERGMRVGQLARRLATGEGWSRQAVGDAFFAGMLYDIGLPVLAGADPQAWAMIQGERVGDLTEQGELEKAHFGCSVTAAGAYLLGLWGFSEPVVEAIAMQPSEPDLPGTIPAALLLSFARRAVCHPEAPQPSSESGYLSADRLGRWQVIARQVLNQPVDAG